MPKPTVHTVRKINGKTKILLIVGGIIFFLIFLNPIRYQHALCLPSMPPICGTEGWVIDYPFGVKMLLSDINIHDH